MPSKTQMEYQMEQTTNEFEIGAKTTQTQFGQTLQTDFQATEASMFNSMVGMSKMNETGMSSSDFNQTLGEFKQKLAEQKAQQK